jgi:hypothetical protein
MLSRRSVSAYELESGNCNRLAGLFLSFVASLYRGEIILILNLKQLAKNPVIIVSLKTNQPLFGNGRFPITIETRDSEKGKRRKTFTRQKR